MANAKPTECDYCGKVKITKLYRLVAYPGYLNRWLCALCAIGHEHNEVKR